MQYTLNGRLNFVRNEDSILVDIPGYLTGPSVDVHLRPGDAMIFVLTQLAPGAVVTFTHYGDISIYCLARETAVTTQKTEDVPVTV